ncbi:MAG: hypothetical protein EOO13_05935 [Chitinophagaceae bacterium]|nr:MAG: hypothetical protein EOO13_05935 [Chitinophagaceae bacterium]
MSPVNYFWIGEQLSPMELLSLQACSKHGHRPIVWSYQQIANLPSSAKLYDAATIMDRSRFAYLRHELQLPLPVISDVFRYQLLNQVGGIYSDTDVVIVKNLQTLFERDDFFCSTYEYGYGVCANNCFMKISSGSTLAGFLCEESERRLKEVEANGLAEENYCYLGPFLVQKCAGDLNVPLLPFDYINPISWRWVPKLIAFKEPDHKFLLKTRIRKYLPFIEGRGYRVTGNTFAIHLCNEIWKRGNLNKNESYHRSSLYEKLKRRIVTS